MTPRIAVRDASWTDTFISLDSSWIELEEHENAKGSKVVAGMSRSLTQVTASMTDRLC